MKSALIRYIRQPLMIAFSTASSEAALPKVFEQLDRFGVPRRISGFILPLGGDNYRVGSTYDWDNVWSGPTTEAREELLARLRKLLLRTPLEPDEDTPFNVVDQVISIYAGTKGFLDDVPLA